MYFHTIYRHRDSYHGVPEILSIDSKEAFYLMTKSMADCNKTVLIVGVAMRDIQTTPPSGKMCIYTDFFYFFLYVLPVTSCSA